MAIHPSAYNIRKELVEGAHEAGIKINTFTVDDEEQNTDLTITGDLTTFQKIRSEKKRTWNLFKALLTMKLRITGKPRKLLTFYRNFWIVQEILSRKIT